MAISNQEIINERLDALKNSPFRAKFYLADADKRIVEDKGLGVIRHHAADFVSKRLAPARPHNDGKQTPFKGYPIFIAQHATATCCRGCLQKWHHIAKGHELTTTEQQYIVDVICVWINQDLLS